jgi:GTP cyclohydrolase IA
MSLFSMFQKNEECDKLNLYTFKSDDQLSLDLISKTEKEWCEQGVISLLKYLGDDPKRDGLKDTPRRVVKAYEEILWGMRVPETEFLDGMSREFDLVYDQMIAVRNIRFTSMCEHHMLPFIGTATVAYIPDAANKGKIIGISKLARIVEYYGARLQVQERMTQQIANALEYLLQPAGIGVWLDAMHTCMCIRGVKAVDSSTVTSELRGAFKTHPETRAEFIALARHNSFANI